MLELRVEGSSFWDEEKEEFVTVPETLLLLEHSLRSISKWESITHKPFLGMETHSIQDSILYIKCMTTNKKPVDEAVYRRLSVDDILKVNNYIDDPMSATQITDISEVTKQGVGRGRTVTSELIYYWMVAHRIPAEYQNWHLNRLLMLIKICNLETQPPKKHTPRELASMYDKLNRERQKKWHTKG